MMISFTIISMAIQFRAMVSVISLQKIEHRWIVIFHNLILQVNAIIHPCSNLFILVELIPLGRKLLDTVSYLMFFYVCQMSSILASPHIDGILPKEPYPPCLGMADRALLAGYPRYHLYIHGISVDYNHVNSLYPCDAMQVHRSGSTLALAMFFAWQNRCYLIIECVYWHLSESILTETAHKLNMQHVFRDYALNIIGISHRGKWVKLK